MILIFTLGLKAIFELFSGRQAGQVWPHCVKRSSLHSIFALQKFHIHSLLFPFPRKPAPLSFARSHTCSGQIVPRNLVASQGLTLLFLVSAICRISKQMVNVCFHGDGLAHIVLCLPVFCIKPFLICRKSAAFFFQFFHRRKLFPV